jgi:RNA polymerase sigma factor (sigma-70 family)
MPSPRKPGRGRIPTLSNNLGAGGRSGPKRGFGGFRGARRLHATTPAVDCVLEPGEVAQGQIAGNADRRRQARFEAIALPHLDTAYALARWMTRNDADAADVVQEAFLRAFRYFDSYRGDDAKSWVLKIVRRTCYSWLDRNHPADVVSLEAEEELGSVAASAIDAEALLEKPVRFAASRPADPGPPGAAARDHRSARAARARLPRNRRRNGRADRNGHVPPSSRPHPAAPRTRSKRRRSCRVCSTAADARKARNPSRIQPRLLVATAPLTRIRHGCEGPRE